MEMTALQWCEFLGGILEGNPHSIITHPAKIEDADEGAISFIGNAKYAEFAYTSKASALIVSHQEVFKNEVKCTLIRVEQPYLAFSQVLEKFNKPFNDFIGIDKSAWIDPTAEIDNEVYIGAMSFIGQHVKIARGVKIFPQVFIGDGVQLGEGSVLYSGVKIYRDCKNLMHP